MRHSRPGTVQPRLLIQMPGRHKRTRRQLLRVQPKPHISGTVLALGQRTGNRFGLVGVVETRHVFVRVILAGAEGGDCAVLLRFGPVEDFLVVLGVRHCGWIGGAWG